MHTFALFETCHNRTRKDMIFSKCSLAGTALIAAALWWLSWQY